MNPTNPTTKKLLYITAMIAYVLYVFYLSEPKYINNVNIEDGTTINYKRVEQYDYVTVPKYSWRDNEVMSGLVVQVDLATGKALVKTDRHYDDFREINIKASDTYRIIGKGTIYHKVNEYVGFNIMIITQVVIGILLAMLIADTAKTFSKQ